MPYLVALSAQEDAHFPLHPGVNLVGRARESDVLIANPSMSRRHAEIVVDKQGVRVRDLGSRHGTRVNGVSIMGETALSTGTHLQFGDALFELCEEAPISVAPLVARAPSADPVRNATIGHGAGGHNRPEALRLGILLRIGELLAQPGRSENLHSRILSLAAEILPLARGVLLSVADDDTLHVVASRVATPTADRPYSESIVRYVRSSRLAALFPDAQADERIGRPESVIAQAIRCAMCAPLLVDDRMLGVLYVDNLLSAHSFTSADLDMLIGFANQAALAMHNAALQERLQRAAIRQNTLERFFPPATAARLMESGGDLGVTELLVTALFCDISGFTAMSAAMAPRDVVAILHAYFPPMARIVFDRDGTLEKYIGDALMAVWGAPFAHDDDADRALEAAVAMQETVARMSPALPWPLAIHVGVHSGIVAFANIGSAEYLQVATIGDATNTAARVCSVAGDGEILITRATADRLTRSSYALTAQPPAKVKGKAEALDLYRVEWR